MNTEIDGCSESSEPLSTQIKPQISLSFDPNLKVPTSQLGNLVELGT